MRDWDEVKRSCVNCIWESVEGQSECLLRKSPADRRSKLALLFQFCLTIARKGVRNSIVGHRKCDGIRLCIMNGAGMGAGMPNCSPNLRLSKCLQQFRQRDRTLKAFGIHVCRKKAQNRVSKSFWQCFMWHLNLKYSCWLSMKSTVRSRLTVLLTVLSLITSGWNCSNWQQKRSDGRLWA